MSTNREPDKKTVLVCSRCGRVVGRLLTPPLPAESSRRPSSEGGLICEDCLGDLEREYQDDEAGKLPPPGSPPLPE